MTMTMSGYVVAHGDYHWQLAQLAGAKSGVVDPGIGVAVSRPRVVRLKALGPYSFGCSEQRCMSCFRRQEAARERQICGSQPLGRPVRSAVVGAGLPSHNHCQGRRISTDATSRQFSIDAPELTLAKLTCSGGADNGRDVKGRGPDARI